MKNDFNMCPMCGSKKIEWRNNRKWICPECGFDLYNNIAAAVGIVLYDKDGNEIWACANVDARSSDEVIQL